MKFNTVWAKWLAEGLDGDDTTKVVVAAMVVGPNVRRIARATGLTYAFVAEKGRRLRENGVWSGSKILCGDPERGPDGIEVALWSLIADGLVEAVAAP